MKSQKLHSLADMYLLGYTLPNIHTQMDDPVKRLGVQHRHQFHDYKTVEMMKKKYGGRGGNIALLHILLDTGIIDTEFVESEVKKMKEFLTTKEVAERLSISENTVREWIKSGRLPATKINRLYRIRIEDYGVLAGSKKE